MSALTPIADMLIAASMSAKCQKRTWRSGRSRLVTTLPGSYQAGTSGPTLTKTRGCRFGRSPFHARNKSDLPKNLWLNVANGAGTYANKRSLVPAGAYPVQPRSARKATKAAAIAATIAPVAMMTATVARKFDPLASSVAVCAASMAQRAASSCFAAAASIRSSFILSRWRCTTGRAGSPHTPASSRPRSDPL